MPPIGPNFTRVAVGPDDHGTPAMFVNGKSDDPKAAKAIAITWAYAEDVAERAGADSLITLRSEATSHEMTADFDPNGGVDWTVTVTTGAFPDVGRFVLLTGRVTMAEGVDAPPVLFWAQTLKVEEK
jgi:hypothetical protein